MGLSFFNSKKRLVAFSSIAVASTVTMLSFQNCAGSKVGAGNELGVSAAASDSVNTNMNSSGDLPVGSIGGAGSIGQFKGDVQLPGFTISKTELASALASNTDSVDRGVVCKLFARSSVAVGETASFMVVMYDSAGKENFDIYKDGSGNIFKFPIAGSAHIDLVGHNQLASGIVGVRERTAQETHRLGHAVYVVNDQSKIGTYTRVAEVFNDKGQLICRTNKVQVVVQAARSASQIASSLCLSKDVNVDSSESLKLCAGYRVLAEGDGHAENKIAVNSALGSVESNAQSVSRLQAAQHCHSGRGLVSRINDVGNGSVLVENECLQ